MLRQVCCACGHRSAEAQLLLGMTSLKPGNIVLCHVCGHIMIRGGDLSLRDMTKEEKLKMQNSPRREAMRALQQEVISRFWG